MTGVKLLCDNCPRGLSNFPTEPCPLAIRTIEAMRHQDIDEEAPGYCPWHAPDVSSHFCYWVTLWRESPVECPKRLAQLLGMTKKEVETLLESALAKLKNLKRNTIADYRDEIENTLKPLDDSIYLQMFDPDCIEDGFEEGFNPIDPYRDTVAEGYKVVKDGVEVVELGIPKDLEGSIPKTRKYVKRRETLKYHCSGMSGTGAVHKDGKKIQVYALSKNWHENAKKFAEMGTPITGAKYTLKGKKNAKETNSVGSQECSEAPHEASKETKGEGT